MRRTLISIIAIMVVVLAYCLEVINNDARKIAQYKEGCKVADSIFAITDSILIESTNPEATLDDPDPVHCDYLDLRFTFDNLK